MTKLGGKRHRLTQLKFDELSLVDRPANPGAKSVLFKRDASTPLKDRIRSALVKAGVLKDDAKSFNAVASQDRLWPLTSALSTAIGSIMCDTELTDTERSAKINESVSQFRAALDELPLFSPAGGGTTIHTDHIDKREDNVKGTLTLEQAMAKIQELEEAQRSGSIVNKNDEIVLADLDPAAAAVLTKAQTEAADAIRKNEELSQRIAKMEQERQIESATALAKGMLGKATGVTATDLATKVLLKLDTEGTAAVESLLKAHNAALQHLELFKELGTVETVEVDGASEERVEKLADELRKADPKLTRAQAIAKVYELHPELYENDGDDDE